MKQNLQLYECNDKMENTVKQLLARIEKSQKILKFYSLSDEQIAEQFVKGSAKTDFLFDL